MTGIRQPLRVGVTGAGGAGKTTLMAELCRRLRGQIEIAAIVDASSTKADAHGLIETGALPPERVIGVDAGLCSHTLVRENAALHRGAVVEMRRRFANLDLILVEAGGEAHAAVSPELADLTIHVIDVSSGERGLSRGGRRVARSDLMVISKIDLASHVGVSPEAMTIGAIRMRMGRPFVLANLRGGEGVGAVIAFLRLRGGLQQINTSEEWR